MELEKFGDAVASGAWHFVCHVVECVGFSKEIFEKLVQGSGDQGSSVIEGRGGTLRNKERVLLPKSAPSAERRGGS
jgi:hypothetical protein